MHLHYPQLLPDGIAVQTIDYLHNQVPWQQIQYYSNKAQRTIKTPRLTYVYGYHKNNNYKFQRKIPKPLREIFLWVAEEFQFTPNFMLLAKYNHPSHSISYHSDDENFIIKGSPIIGINLCLDQTQKLKFKLKNKTTKEIQTYNLSHKDVFYMSWNNQRTHMHSIPKNQAYVTPRYGLTFRQGNEYAINNYYKYN